MNDREAIPQAAVASPDLCMSGSTRATGTSLLILPLPQAAADRLELGVLGVGTPFYKPKNL